jgi:hypothetical protein
MTMRKKIKAVVVIAIVTAAVLVKISLPAAQASTTACGSVCFSLSVQSQGTSEDLTVGGNDIDGYTVSLAAASTTNSDQDFTEELYAPLTTDVITDSGVLSSKLLFNYVNDQVAEFQWAPDGDTSDFCLASGTSGADDENQALTVTLDQCGLSAATLWILDGQGVNDYIDLISAGYASGITYGGGSGQLDNDEMTSGTGMFAEPAVLTYSSKSGIILGFLTDDSGAVSTGQMWTGFQGA